ncbi:hypothetical protein SARC_00253 [Sphaeroforma arctica JP610]|uniref:ABC transporter domain-containing protein n=1 Tax=Sphaeroforma arctica JP610 TaxID=667725 RepID=A0A0L0GF59_9EUKA|nr:hypothetical protein SARC_00253 [Sphaeroforma arctica JP610]KNC87622.1 hypothetical protein SARC_00253 [Sphaeroforma arctica JP610]|eukprot:XP_014161524.1 hypothetical protein SARC_00253 [Sphaeroforma arctica JP610]
MDTQGSCNCNGTEGWDGLWCQACQTDAACQGEAQGTPSSRCNQNWIPLANKTYSCETTDSAIAGILGQPAVVSVALYVTQEGNVTQRGGTFQLLRKEEPKTNRIDLFSCLVEDCDDTTSQHPAEAAAGGFAWRCNQVNCMMNCEPGSEQCSTILRGIVGVVGGPMDFLCDPSTGLCAISEKHLDVIARGGVHIRCKGGECVHASPIPSASPGIIASSTPVPSDPNVDSVVPLAIIVMVGGVCIVGMIIAGFLLCYFLRKQRLRKEHIEFNHQDVNTYLRGLRNKNGGIRTLAFDELCYEIGRKKKAKQILYNVSGYSQPGELLAIMGPSGAGKSTVMDILSMRDKSGRTSGSITIGGKQRTSAFKRDIGFVDQEDLLIDTLTVAETLMYSAELRLPDCVPHDVKQRRVKTVMNDLSISHIAHSRIGGTFARGISGGEKRRVSIGTELVTCPSILYLDEPTSGLDSYNAHLVVSCLTKFARQDRTNVIMTIHQPRSNIFAMFDKLLLLSKGQNIYFGPANQAITYFATMGLHCPNTYNPADFLIDAIVEAEMREREEEEDMARSLLLTSGNRRESDDSLLRADPSARNLSYGEFGDVELNTHTVSIVGGSSTRPLGRDRDSDSTDDDSFLFDEILEDTRPTPSASADYGHADHSRPHSRNDLDLGTQMGDSRVSGASKSVSGHPRSPTNERQMRNVANSTVSTTDMVNHYQKNRLMYEREDALLYTDGISPTDGEDDGLYRGDDSENDLTGHHNEGILGRVDVSADTSRNLRVGAGQIFSGDLGDNRRIDNGTHLDDANGFWSEEDTGIDEDLIDINESLSERRPLSSNAATAHASTGASANRRWLRRKSKAKSAATSASFSTQIVVLSNRTMLNLFRNPMLFFGHLLSATLIGLVVGTVYYGMNEDTGSDEGAVATKSLVGQFEQRLGVLLILCAFLAFGSLSSLELFYSERALYMHERANRFYYPSTYFISKILFDIVPLRIIPPLLMGSIAYFMIGLRPGIVYFTYFLVALVLVNLVATSICMIIGVMCSRLSTGNLIASIIMLFSLMLTNIFNNKSMIQSHPKR